MTINPWLDSPNFNAVDTHSMLKIRIWRHPWDDSRRWSDVCGPNTRWSDGTIFTNDHSTSGIPRSTAIWCHRSHTDTMQLIKVTSEIRFFITKFFMTSMKDLLKTKIINFHHSTFIAYFFFVIIFAVVAEIEIISFPLQHIAPKYHLWYTWLDLTRLIDWHFKYLNYN